MHGPQVSGITIKRIALTSNNLNTILTLNYPGIVQLSFGFNIKSEVMTYGNRHIG